VHLPATEPLGVRQLPIEHFLERAAPGEVLPRLPAPEFLGSVDRLGIEPLIQCFAPKVGLGFELGRRPDNPGFPGYRGNRLVGHVVADWGLRTLERRGTY